MFCPNVTKFFRSLKIFATLCGYWKCAKVKFLTSISEYRKKINSQKFRSHYKYAYSRVTYGSVCSLTENFIIKESVIFSLIPIETSCRVHYVLKNSTCSIPYYFWTFRNFLLKNLHEKYHLSITLVYKVNHILLLKLFLRPIFIKILILLLILLKIQKLHFLLWKLVTLGRNLW